ncbi:exo-beta-N-acetylmuramidase NamZ family protein [Natronoflexus pectinivorans]|uniref:Uncharacterized protein YbbC (DUF1343 family) n=1 Tax=Natronoflexus pectinivorans TaxID=682526 RepID=A0A4V6NMR0_9BACT|nr:DUF1343 domain-containing protein [Natronoflexus pectinivorans]TCO08918.1 uncharacterized protein YbbC (DUF1343 family) [Natronoflexus pectinivorans]
MRLSRLLFFQLPVLFSAVVLSACPASGDTEVFKGPLKTGADRIHEWLPMVKDKKVGLLVNHTAVTGEVHLVDTLLSLGIDVERIFVPEHGFRGDADAGELIDDGVDAATGTPIVSLYSETRKPTPEQMAGLDVVIFDIQDVGARFYTYISSMHYMMEACAEAGIPMIVLDRPNPNGDYFDGPVLQPGFTSFVGMHPIPLVHGLTVGELALMINGERWLKNNMQCHLTVVEAVNYTKDMHYSVMMPPSPNLPNDLSIRLYPSLCFFEATNVSIGRGTYFPFQVIGYPDPKFGEFTFTPVSIKGMATSPPQQNKKCYGVDLRELDPWEQRFTLKYYMEFFRLSGNDAEFTSRRRWFNLLAGNDTLLKQIESGMSEEEIRATWKDEHAAYDRMRQPYLLYK